MRWDSASELVKDAQKGRKSKDRETEIGRAIEERERDLDRSRETGIRRRVL